MPRHEPAKRQTAGEPPPERLKMRLGPDGKWVVDAAPEPPPDQADLPEPAGADED